MFKINSRLEADSFWVKDLKLSQLRLINDQRYPWLMLVPRYTHARELIDLKEGDQQLLMQEITYISHILTQIWQPFKINVATLGNVVSQLHIHIIGRFENDFAWPNPVWNCGQAEKYLASEANTLIMRLQQHLEPNV